MSKPRLANWEIAACALWLLGGATIRKDTEEVAVRCWELAPERFRWKRYPEFPDKRTAGEALRDGKKNKNGALIGGDERDGWILTEAGLRWARGREQLGEGNVPPRGLSALAVGMAGALSDLASHDTYRRWKAGAKGIPKYEVAIAIQLPADAPHWAVNNRLREMRNAAALASLEDLEAFLKWLDNATQAE